jgi:hypothetical protein
MVGMSRPTCGARHRINGPKRMLNFLLPRLEKADGDAELKV